MSLRRGIAAKRKTKASNENWKIAIIQTALPLSISTAVMAQSSGGQGVPSPIGAHVLPNTPSAMETPSTIPGGLYRLANGFLSCPDTLYLMSGQPNLRTCTYVKDVH